MWLFRRLKDKILEVTSQETSSVDQAISSQDTDNDWEGRAWGEMDG